MNFFFRNKINLFFFLFTSLILILIYERFICHNNGINWGGVATLFKGMYNNPVYLTFCHYNKFDTLNLWDEGNFVENLQAILLFFSLIFIFHSVKIIKKRNIILYYFLFLYFLGLIYFFGEEISWGQHIFHWTSPDIFIEINNQNETNLHNISNLLNELPRTLVLIWCSFSALIIIFFSNFYNIDKTLISLIYPNKNLLYIAFLLFFFTLPDLIIDKFDLTNIYVSNLEQSIFFEKISFNFLRLSELQELIFCYYFFIHSITLRAKLSIT
jgi:hypothetical protein